jgi:hypothetical protein
MDDRERMQRADALTRELARVVVCHLDSLDNHDAVLISTMAISAVFALRLREGILRETGRAPSSELLLRHIHAAPWPITIEAAELLAKAGLV